MPSPLEGAAWRLTPKVAVQLAVASVVIPIVLAELYVALTPLFSSAWLAAAWLHTLLACGVMAYQARRGELRRTWSCTSVGPQAPAWLKARPWVMFVPAAAVLLGAAALVVASRSLGGAPPGAPPGVSTRLAWILWVPVVEEWVFRGGIGAAMRARGGNLWGAWFSAIVFALAHAEPTLASLAHARLGLPMGPFLLGLCCEAVYATTARIAPAIALHAACNATVVVFALGDVRWLDWLGFLYF